MVNLQEVIDDARPMLEDFLEKVGIYQPGQPIADADLCERFSDWIDEQNVREKDFVYLGVRVAAFICEYLIDGHGGIRYVEGKQILLRLPIDVSQGVYRVIDPYKIAMGLVRERSSLKEFLHILCS